MPHRLGGLKPRLSTLKNYLRLRGPRCGVLCSLLAVIVSTGQAYCQLSTTGAEQVSVGIGPSGEPVAPESNKPNSAPVMPPNSKFVIFSSTANNLIPSAHNQTISSTPNIYQRDGTTTKLVSANFDNSFPKKAGGNDLIHGCIEPAVSDVAGDGSFAVTFTSDANDLVRYYQGPGQNPTGPTQVYLRIYRPDKDPSTILISEAIKDAGGLSDAIYGANERSDQPTVTRFPAQNGDISHRYSVCFRSKAGDFIGQGGPAKSIFTIYCRQGIGFKPDGSLDPGTRLEINAPPVGSAVSAEGHSVPSLSGDGSTLVFASDLTLSLDWPNNYSPLKKQVYSYAFGSRALSLISFQKDERPADGDSDNPSVSFDGGYVAFTHLQTSTASPSGLLKGFSPSLRTFFVRHTRGSTSYLQINTNALGTPSNGVVYSGRLHETGRYAAFSDTGSNLPGGGDTPFSQVYFKDLQPSDSAPGGALITVSTSATGVVGDLHSGRDSSSMLARHVTLGSFMENGVKRFSASFTSLARNFGGFGTPSSTSAFIFRSIVLGDFGDGGAPEPTPTPTPTPEATKTPLSEEPGREDPELLVPNAPINEPPRIEVQPSGGRKRFEITIFCQLFTLDPRYLSSAELSALASKKARITYAVEIRKAGSRQRITRTSSRNVVTVRKLEPGRYTVRYRVSAQSGKRTIRSRTSPPATIVLS